MAASGRRVNKQNSFERGSARAGRWGIALPAGHAYEPSASAPAPSLSLADVRLVAVEWRLRERRGALLTLAFDALKLAWSTARAATLASRRQLAAADLNEANSRIARVVFAQVEEPDNARAILLAECMLSDDLLAAAGEREAAEEAATLLRIRLGAVRSRLAVAAVVRARASLVARCFAALKSSVITKRLAVDAAPTAAARGAHGGGPEAAELRARIAAVMRETEELTAALIQARVDMAGEHLAALDAGHELRRLRKLEVFAEPRPSSRCRPPPRRRRAGGGAARAAPAAAFVKRTAAGGIEVIRHLGAERASRHGQRLRANGSPNWIRKDGTLIRSR